MDIEVGKNSYMTIEEADKIVEDQYFEDDAEYEYWNSLDNKGKTRLILKGTSEIDILPFLGSKVVGFGMSWPRSIFGVYTECPYDIKVAIVRHSISERLQNKREETSLIKNGVKSYSIKGASISFSDDAGVKSKVAGVIDFDIYKSYLSKWTY